MELIDSIQKIEKLLSLESQLAFIKQNQIQISNRSFEIPEGAFVFEHQKDIFLKNDHYIHSLNTLTGQIKRLIDVQSEGFIVINSNELLTSQSENGTYSLTKYDLSNQIQVWKMQTTGLYYSSKNNDTLLNRHGFRTKRVEKINLQDGTFDWEINSPDGFEMYKTAYFLSDFIVIPFVKGSLGKDMKVKLAGFNIETGEKLWEIDSPGTGITEWKENESDGKLYSLYEYREGQQLHLQLTILNPINGKFETYTIKQDHGGLVLPWNTQIEGDKIYYSDNVKGCRVGVVDLSKKELLDEIKLNLDEGVQIAEPYPINDRIYVLDTLKTMHTIQVN